MGQDKSNPRWGIQPSACCHSGDRITNRISLRNEASQFNFNYLIAAAVFGD